MESIYKKLDKLEDNIEKIDIDPIELTFELMSILSNIHHDDVFNYKSLSSYILECYELFVTFSKYADSHRILDNKGRRILENKEMDILYRFIFWTLIRLRKDSNDEFEYGPYSKSVLPKIFIKVLSKGGMMIPIYSAKELLLELLQKFRGPLHDELISVVERINQDTPVPFLVRLYREITTGVQEMGNETYPFSELSDFSEFDPIGLSDLPGPLRKAVTDYIAFRDLPSEYGKKKRASKGKKRSSKGKK